MASSTRLVLCLSFSSMAFVIVYALVGVELKLLSLVDPEFWGYHAYVASSYGSKDLVQRVLRASHEHPRIIFPPLTSLDSNEWSEPGAKVNLGSPLCSTPAF
jgi:hypothetical protein